MDPVADMLTSIRNTQAVLGKKVIVPFSKLKYKIAKLLEKEGFVEKVSKKGRGVKKKIMIKLKYQDDRPFISGLKKISKPGRSIHLGAKEIRPVRSGYGISIISTSQGLLTDKEARKKNIGGEVICKVW